MQDEKLYVFLIGAVILFAFVCLVSLAIAYCRKEHNKDEQFIIHTPLPSTTTTTTTSTNAAV